MSYRCSGTAECESTLEKLEKHCNNGKTLGVSVHPDYGSWFAFRCVFALPSVKVTPDEKKMLMNKEPQRLLSRKADIAQLLYELNKCVLVLYTLCWNLSIYSTISKSTRT